MVDGMSTEADLADEDALYTKLEKLGCRSFKDLRYVLFTIGIPLEGNEPASISHLRAALAHLKTKRPKKGASHGP
jgi:hypothetical protein